MPQVKFDYVVSFSSEDPEHPASNLLLREVSKKKWLCKKGEPSSSVVLQLAKSCKISTVRIGVQHAAMVEVLVGRSETPNEPFQVLVAKSVFVGCRESRAATGAECVRAFSGAALEAGAAAQRWDRLRLHLHQPYNKHVPFGVRFVHVFEEDAVLPPDEAQAAPLSDDEERFTPGELFAAHRRALADTGAQIRRASSLAMKNGSNEPTGRRVPTCATDVGSRRNDTPTTPKREEEPGDDANSSGAEARPPTPTEHSDDEWEGARADREGATRPLAGAVLVFSGYVHPERGHLRATALRLGAAVQPHWTPDATHLVCAFPNTPKLRSARAGGERVRAVLGQWLRECEARGCRVPWRAHATLPADRWPEPPAPPPDTDSDDTLPDEVSESPGAPLQTRVPPALAGRRVAVRGGALLRRYARAYGALLVAEEEADEVLHARDLWRLHAAITNK